MSSLFFGKYCQDPNKEYHYDDQIDESIDQYGIIGARLHGGKDNWFSHKSAESIKQDLGDEIFDKYIKFCVIRNPYDKMVSRYFWDIKENFYEDDFDHYITYMNVNNLDIHCINGTRVCDYFIRYENLEEDIIKLCKILGIEDYDINNLPKHKSTYRTDKRHYSNYYNEETRKIVYENHAEEFELFQYKFKNMDDI